MINEKLFINLKILGKIQKNGKISRSHNGTISLESSNVLQFVKRFVANDSRKQSIFEINSIINECIDSINNIFNSKYMNKLYYNTNEYYINIEDLTLLLKELNLAKNGIMNLQFTYTSDQNITLQLEVVLIKINSNIKDFNNKLKYFTSLLPINIKNTLTTNYPLDNSPEVLTSLPSIRYNETDTKYPIQDQTTVHQEITENIEESEDETQRPFEDYIDDVFK